MCLLWLLWFCYFVLWLCLFSSCSCFMVHGHVSEICLVDMLWKVVVIWPWQWASISVSSQQNFSNAEFCITCFAWLRGIAGMVWPVCDAPGDAPWGGVTWWGSLTLPQPQCSSEGGTGHPSSSRRVLGCQHTLLWRKGCLWLAPPSEECVLAGVNSPHASVSEPCMCSSHRGWQAILWCIVS